MNDEQDDKGARHRRVKLELPDTVDLTTVGQAEMAVIRAAAEGKISSRVALDFTLMLDRRRKAIFDCDIEKQMDEIVEARRQRELAERNRR
jgi:hypothetical protein